jgi:hypothetical protein
MAIVTVTFRGDNNPKVLSLVDNRVVVRCPARGELERNGR